MKKIIDTFNTSLIEYQNAFHPSHLPFIRFRRYFERRRRRPEIPHARVP